MKDILIVIHGLGCGGAEKSLVSFLKKMDMPEWNVDLLVMRKDGMFMKDIPEYVNLITDDYDIENYATPLNKRRKKVSSLRDLFCQACWQIRYPLVKKKGRNYSEVRWELWGQYLPRLKKHYDLAISYIHGGPNYFVIDKVNASKKILWIHNEFEKTGMEAAFERRFFAGADKIVTISQSCVESFLRVFPEFKDKMVVLENISSPSIINLMAEKKDDDPFFKTNRKRIVSIGRLNSQKGFDFAVAAAKILKDKGVKFLWYILGEGGLRNELQAQIDKNNLQNDFVLAGVRENPYCYIADCDIFAQPSRFEGKSIALDEAKILCKPIVVTNYITVVDSIEHEKNGFITEMNPESIAEGIMRVLNDDALRQSLIDELEREEKGNESEIKKYVGLFKEVMQEE